MLPVGLPVDRLGQTYLIIRLTGFIQTHSSIECGVQSGARASARSIWPSRRVSARRRDAGLRAGAGYAIAVTRRRKEGGTRRRFAVRGAHLGPSASRER